MSMMSWSKLAVLVAASLLFASPGAVGAACTDRCQLGELSEGASCALWDSTTASWIDVIDDGPGRLHNRARAYLPWLRNHLMPSGGVMSAIFTADDYAQVASYGGERDPAIWTGAYLAAEALRYMTTGAPDAREQMTATLEVLHRWWNLPGDPGYLARFAAPADSPPEVLATLPANDAEVHRDRLYEGALWHWRGDVSRDQYQGVMLGYSLAYQASNDPRLREMIRTDVVEFAEQLMRVEERNVAVIVNGTRSVVKLELENVIYSTSDMVDGRPTLEIDLGSQEVEGHGLLVFWPNPSEFLRQLPGLWWLPDIELPSQAVQLAAAFRVALQVTEGVAGYEQRRQAIAAYYDRRFGDWLDIASNWENTNDCGDSYHGLNIAFLPLFNWARLETNPVRRRLIQEDVLETRLWPAVEAHKNVLFAFIYASQAAFGADVAPVIARHVEQLRGFPPAPNQAVSVDLRGLYPEDQNCPGLSAVAVDVAERARATFTWERQPWKLQDPGVSNRLYGGVDYLLAYWMGRYFGFLADDAPGTCLAFRTSGEPPDADKDGVPDAIDNCPLLANLDQADADRDGIGDACDDELGPPRFADVPYEFWAWAEIDAIAEAGITIGCAPELFCPGDAVSRAQMAAFLLRALSGDGYTPPAATGTLFSDVPPSHWAVDWIERLAAIGITTGCGAGLYCPERAVSRAEMAIFLLRALYGSDYVPAAATGSLFLDVPLLHWAAAWIEQLAAVGITSGCGGGNFCPDEPVTRAQMATFLARALELALPPPP